MCSKMAVKEGKVIVSYFHGAPHHLILSLAIQLSLAFGLAGLLWPEKFLAVFDVLMFPWPSSYRTVRGNSIAAIALSILLFLVLSSRH
jgi:hypothetical protein